jgi:hypothetical protein
MVFDEKVLGLATSVSGSAVTQGLSYGALQAGVPSDVVVPAISIAFGNFFALYMDAVFAKRTFQIAGRAVDVPYADFAFRHRWFLRSLVSPTGLKYFTVALFDGVIVYSIYKAARAKLDDAGFFTTRKNIRDTVLVGLISASTFLVYANRMRFDWAFQPDPAASVTGVVLVVAVVASVLAMSMARSGGALWDLHRGRAPTPPRTD